ncbi:MAG: hypothetical protein ACOY30_08700 [Bacillota bacterium]
MYSIKPGNLRIKRILIPLFLAAGLAVVCFTLYRATGMAPAVRQALPACRGGDGVGFNYPSDPGRVIIVTMDYLQIKDLEGELNPNLSKLTARGAAALMNVNTGGLITPDNAHATIGSGAHVSAGNASAHVFASSEASEKGTAAEEYRRRTGEGPPGGSLVFLDITRLRILNENLGYTVVPGALGTSIHEAGYRTAVLGNSDDRNGPRRPAASIVMDHRGIVDAGAVGASVVRREKDFIHGFSTDYAGILKEYDRLAPDVKLVAIDLGDLGRLQSAREYMEADHWIEWRARIIGRADRFLEGLVGRMDKKDLLIMICPTPGDDGIEKDRLSPVLLYGGCVPPGLLVSPTTKRPGLIMNVDVAPTVLDFLGIPRPAYFTGRPARVIPGDFDIGMLSAMYRVIEVIYESRPVLQKGYVIFQLALLAVSLWYIFLVKKGKEILKPFFLSIMSVPLAYLLVPLFPAGGVIMLSALLITITLLITLISLWVHKIYRIDSFLFIGLVTMTAVALDIAAGSPLQKVSVLGYDPVVGARFYGLGNEYMGVLIGSTLVGTSALISAADKRRGPLILTTGAVYILIIYLIASPQFGTNVGGTISAASAFMVAFLMILGIRFDWRALVAVVLGVALVVLAFMLYDAGRPSHHQSHIGRTAGLIASEGLDTVVGIINRKTEMNVKLIKYTIWSRIFISSLAILALLFYRPRGVMEGIKNRHPYLFRGLVGVITGSIVAFIFNDSGVVAAATTMIFGAPPLIYLVLDELEGRGGDLV